jgi:hypothetical protein
MQFFYITSHSLVFSSRSTYLLAVVLMLVLESILSLLHLLIGNAAGYLFSIVYPEHNPIYYSMEFANIVANSTPSHSHIPSTTETAKFQLAVDSVDEGVINLVKTEGYDVVVLGASREGLLQQTVQGNIPEAIASGVESTVILVRGAITS